MIKPPGLSTSLAWRLIRLILLILLINLSLNLHIHAQTTPTPTQINVTNRTYLVNFFQKDSPLIGLLDKIADSLINSLDLVEYFNNSAPAATATPTSGQQPTLPPIGTTQGIWISKEEIMKLPASGSAWNSVLSAANSSWGSANLGDNNSNHDVLTLAGALVAVRNNDNAMRTKTIAGLQSAMKSPLTRALELSRGLQTYIIAADIIGYQDTAFKNWVKEMVYKNVSPHSGGSDLCNSSGIARSCSDGVHCTALRSPNNWGGHARASAIAAALYTNDQTLITEMVNAHKAFIGLNFPNHLYCQSTNWHTDSSNKYGVNRKGSMRGSINISGVLPEDWRRASEFKWPPDITGYMWEGMQGYVVSAVILHRAGLVPFNSGDNAVVRSMDILYHRGEAASNPTFTNPASGDDTWIPWVVNYYGGTTYPTNAASSGKNMGYTDWTHAKTSP